MSPAIRHALAFVAALAASGFVPAQNAQMHHWDGTTLGASRGGLNTVPAGFYQRYPADQTAGAIAIHEFNVKLQDQNAATVENLTLLIRGNTSAGPATGSPDVGPFGALGGVIFNAVSFGTLPGPSAVIMQVIFPSFGVPVPTGTVPSGDMYVGIDIPATTGTNANYPIDSLAPLMNATLAPDQGEQFRSSFVGYSGSAGVMGLGWQANLTTGVSNVSAGNRSWLFALRPWQDVLQPFANNAGLFVGGSTAGLNPNFGFAGIAPDVIRGDGIGWRLRSNAPPGSSVIVGYDNHATFATSVGLDGFLCLDLLTASLFPAPVTTSAIFTPPPLAPSHSSEATIGPFFGLAGLNGFGNLIMQCGTVDPGAVGGIRLSTIARVNF